MAKKGTKSRGKAAPNDNSKTRASRAPAEVRERAAAPKEANQDGGPAALKTREEITQASEEQAPFPEPKKKSIAWLKAYGSRLDWKPLAGMRVGRGQAARQAISIRECLMNELLKIRSKNSRLRNLLLNAAQLQMERRSTRRNIVLKA